MNAVYDVILEPVSSEKSMSLLAEGKYTFWVHPKANKTLVKNAIQKAFNVKVVAVNIQNVRGTHKRVGRFSGLTAARRKAIVQLAEGQKIEALEVVS
ncbi:MAG: 50S ribosomal protein L23 [Deinococcales bacterium]